MGPADRHSFLVVLVAVSRSCPLSIADSVGHRNTRFKSLGGRPKAERLAWTLIQLPSDLIQALLCVHREINLAATGCLNSSFQASLHSLGRADISNPAFDLCYPDTLIDGANVIRILKCLLVLTVGLNGPFCAISAPQPVESGSSRASTAD